MSLKLSKISCSIILSAIIFLLLPYHASAQSSTITFPTADTYVGKDVNEDMSYKRLMLASDSYYTYLKFNLASVPDYAQVHEISLSFRTTNASTESFSIYTSSPDWLPESINWTNKPQPNTSQLLATFSPENDVLTQNHVLLDSTILEAYLGKEISLVVLGNTNQAIEIFYSEHGHETYRPQLKISYSTSQNTLICKSDVDQNKLVDLTDFSIMASDFFQSHPGNPRSDINSDGIVDLIDYSLLSAHYQKTCN